MTPEELRQSLGLAEDASDEEVRAKLAELQAETPAAPAEGDDGEEDGDDDATGDGDGVGDGEEVEEPEGAAVAAATGDGPVTLDRGAYDQLQRGAAAGLRVEAAQRERERDDQISAAITAGKFPPARRDHYITAWDADPDGTRQLIASLAPGLVPVDERGSAGGDTVSASEYDQSWLSPVERERVAAAHSGEGAGSVTLERPQGRG